MKKFFNEFKTFISRGNVLDMAVGVIIGSAFTAVINSLVNGILKPLINAIPGADRTSALQIVLVKATENTEAVVLDFGAVISAVITFLITAFVLFIIVKTINSIREGGKRLAEKQKKKIEKQLKKGKITEEEAAVAKAEAAPVAPAAPVETTDDLLREIRDLLKARNTDAALKTAEENSENGVLLSGYWRHRCAPGHLRGFCWRSRKTGPGFVQGQGH